MGIRPLKEALEEPEKRIIIQALQAFNWNRQETARVAGYQPHHALQEDEEVWPLDRRADVAGPNPTLTLVANSRWTPKGRRLGKVGPPAKEFPPLLDG